MECIKLTKQDFFLGWLYTGLINWKWFGVSAVWYGSIFSEVRWNVVHMLTFCRDEPPEFYQKRHAYLRPCALSFWIEVSERAPYLFCFPQAAVSRHALASWLLTCLWKCSCCGSLQGCVMWILMCRFRGKRSQTILSPPLENLELRTQRPSPSTQPPLPLVTTITTTIMTFISTITTFMTTGLATWNSFVKNCFPLLRENWLFRLSRLCHMSHFWCVEWTDGIKRWTLPRLRALMPACLGQAYLYISAFLVVAKNLQLELEWRARVWTWGKMSLLAMK